MAVFFIDRFIMPAASRAAFMERATINRNIIKILPGFIEDNFYETQTGDEYRVVTVAVWKNEEAVANAKSVVLETYRQQGFDMPAMLKRLNIQVERGVYSRMES